MATGPAIPKLASVNMREHTYRIGRSVWQHVNTFETEAEADAFQKTLEGRLDGSIPIPQTATISRDQPHPDLPVVQQLLIDDIEWRRQHGLAKYKVPLQPFDGSDPDVEMYQEFLDLMVYFRMKLYERFRR